MLNLKSFYNNISNEKNNFSLKKRAHKINRIKNVVIIQKKEIPIRSLKFNRNSYFIKSNEW